MLRPILRLGDSILSEPAQPVGALTPDIDRLIDDMLETMYAAPGIGLAATQIGIPLRIFVIDTSAGRDPQALLVMINPAFVDRLRGISRDLIVRKIKKLARAGKW